MSKKNYCVEKYTIKDWYIEKKYVWITYVTENDFKIDNNCESCLKWIKNECEFIMALKKIEKERNTIKPRKPENVEPEIREGGNVEPKIVKTKIREDGNVEPENIKTKIRKGGNWKSGNWKNMMKERRRKREEYGKKNKNPYENNKLTTKPARRGERRGENRGRHINI